MKNLKKTVTGIMAAAVIISAAGVSAEAKRINLFNKNYYFTNAEINSILGKFPNINDCFQNGTVQKPETEKPEKPAPDIQKPEESVPETEKPENNEGVTNASQFELKVLELVNNERAKNGLSALELKENLSEVARNHSMDMAKNKYFDHTNLKGQSPFDRLKSAGISYSYAGENIAAGQNTPQAVVNAWMNSEGHRKNILSKNFNKIGLGYYNGGPKYHYWTQVFTS